MSSWRAPTTTRPWQHIGPTLPQHDARRGERDCICIETRVGIYGEIWPEPEGNPEGKAQGISRGLRLYFTVYPNSSHNTDILNYNSSIVLPGRALFEELILCIALAAGAIFSSTLQALLGVYWKIRPQLYWEYI